ncbi:MAG: hypothetical protein EXS52_02425 [Candidatus Staskawiczbacteria bacterium]|nr:hypothetical protein [Candidatus Staskawiczbacteria bacterium]
MKKTLILMIILIIAVILLIAGFFVYQNYYNIKPQTQNTAQTSEQNEGTQCKQYTNFSYVINYLKSHNAGVPVLLPPSLPKSYTTPWAGKLYINYLAGDVGGYSVAMSLGYDANYDCTAGDANAMGVFMAYTDAVGMPVYFKDGEKISLVNGIQGYYSETGRGSNANINWMYKGVYYQTVDLHMTKAEAIAMINSAIDAQSQCQAAITPEIKNLTYDDARVKIIAAGWKSVQTYSSVNDFPSMTGNITVFWNKGYKELQDCAGTGLGQCLFLFQDSCGNYLHVSTGGIEEGGYHATVQASSVNQSKEGF